MKQSSVIDTIRKKRLVFTVTTGRSGTAYLAAIFGYAQNVHSFHEPVPEYAKVLRAAQGDPACARRFLLEEKFPEIALDGTDIYIETSHLACKGFLEPMLDLGIVPDLIIHRRNPRDVALSMFTMGTIPGRSDKGLRFYLSPDDPGVLELSDWQELHDYQLCYWYCLEIERRAIDYSKLFVQHGARIAETTLFELKTFSGLKNCFLDLDLKLKFPSWLTRFRFLRSSGVKVNESKETKKEVIRLINLAELENEVKERIMSHDMNKMISDIETRDL